MTQTSYLNGKLLKISLPAFSSPPPPNASGPKRLFLPQGELAHFYDGPEGVQYIAFMELREGSIRGNHWHRLKEEHIYVIAGELLLVARRVEESSETAVSIKLLAGDLAVIAPVVAHALKTIVPGQAVEFAPTPFNPADTQRFALL
jgi:dTDP-4-dehydrorhamnose 3,5-epimerase-like enzyme